MSSQKTALVVFSGGQDSTTCLLLALRDFDSVIAVTFDYGQRHGIELKCAKKIAEITNVSHTIVDLSTLGNITENALTRSYIEIKAREGGIPTTFVDGRNLLFLSYAAILAKKHGIHDIFAGVCQTDYSGYPDCRRDFIDSLEKTLELSMEYPFTIHTPLMFLTKKESVLLMKDLGGLPLLAETHTCYYGRRPACGKCSACLLRLKGFREAGMADPLEYDHESPLQ